jgi:uncharacterized protein YjiS (DUF1127 family)
MVTILYIVTPPESIVYDGHARAFFDRERQTGAIMRRVQFLDGAMNTIGASAKTDNAVRKPSGVELLMNVLSGRFGSQAAGLKAWLQLRRTRQSLLELTDDQLRDVGITRRMADREAAKSRFIA